eukprot:CAMPEP_0173381878 /NCGR_PEP_ID=MMETSP1356-20130122/4313_1 /TAXON_ID=77927 ORGANISM="Hemiselmis virescens, Strain PCC157" /NCGR_SAMPLE_ID=MMETSP1356 /ASSEMBLY_ACC=CAM_ASM_000847 /LENGTH=344 /DNA_ID=CAMNT_0014335925 /DNA_START=179 /DNA_END=1210 /DNA_ORIENTATION=-
MSGFNPNRSKELSLQAMLAQQWETDTKTMMTGQQGIDKMKEMLTQDGVLPCDERSVPPEWQDALLLRFWVGFKKNCAVAAEAFRKMLQWRKDKKINDIRDKIMGGLQPEQFPRYEQLRRFYPLLKTGFDKNGCPINITLTGLIDPAKLVQTATTEEIRMYIVYEMEYKLVQLCKLTQETGILYRALEVHDLKGLGMHHLATGPIALLRKIVNEVSSNYVELADKVLLLNVPYATVVRSVLKQVVPARSQHKLAVMGGVEDYSSILEAHADRDQYHECLFGGALPEGLEDSGEDDINKWSSVSVPARDKKVMKEEVGAGKTFLWSVCPASQDIGLEIVFVPKAKG